MIINTFWTIYLLTCIFGIFFALPMAKDIIQICLDARQNNKAWQSPSAPPPTGNPDPNGNGHDGRVLNDRSFLLRDGQHGSENSRNSLLQDGPKLLPDS